MCVLAWRNVFFYLLARSNDLVFTWLLNLLISSVDLYHVCMVICLHYWLYPSDKDIVGSSASSSDG